MELRAINGGGSTVEDAFEAAPFDYVATPLRPGVAHEVLVVHLPDGMSVDLGRSAAEEGLMAEHWATLVIESERVLRAASGNRRAEDLAVELSARARDPQPATLTRRARRLAGYARSLRAARPTEPLMARDNLSLAVPYHCLLAWEREATAGGSTVERWATELLTGLPAGRILWEAAAAESGAMLDGWVGLQAASSASS
jgi:hypothetical protein